MSPELGEGLECRLVFPEGEFERARQVVESHVSQRHAVGEGGLILHAASEAEARAISGRLLEAPALDSPAGFSMGMAYRRSAEGLEAALSRAA